jgi:superfamily II DNA helicase RecQ
MTAAQVVDKWCAASRSMSCASVAFGMCVDRFGTRWTVNVAAEST